MLCPDLANKETSSSKSSGIAANNSNLIESHNAAKQALWTLLIINAPHFWLTVEAKEFKTKKPPNKSDQTPAKLRKQSKKTALLKLFWSNKVLTKDYLCGCSFSLSASVKIWKSSIYANCSFATVWCGRLMHNPCFLVVRLETI